MPWWLNKVRHSLCACIIMDCIMDIWKSHLWCISAGQSNHKIALRSIFKNQMFKQTSGYTISTQSPYMQNIMLLLVITDLESFMNLKLCHLGMCTFFMHIFVHIMVSQCSSAFVHLHSTDI